MYVEPAYVPPGSPQKSGPPKDRRAWMVSGDLVSRLVTPITHIMTLLKPIIDLTYFLSAY